jgi:hypothetical protein
MSIPLLLTSLGLLGESSVLACHLAKVYEDDLSSLRMSIPTGSMWQGLGLRWIWCSRRHAPKVHGIPNKILWTHLNGLSAAATRKTRCIRVQPSFLEARIGGFREPTIPHPLQMHLRLLACGHHQCWLCRHHLTSPHESARQTHHSM